MARKSSAERAQLIAGGYATAKKNIVLQFQNRERNVDHLMEQIRKDALNRGVRDDEIEVVDVYIKPEEQAVFYVINKETEGKISL